MVLTHSSHKPPLTSQWELGGEHEMGQGDHWLWRLPAKLSAHEVQVGNTHSWELELQDGVLQSLYLPVRAIGEKEKRQRQSNRESPQEQDSRNSEKLRRPGWNPESTWKECLRRILLEKLYLHSCSVPVCLLNTWHSFHQLILTINPWGLRYHFPKFIDQEMSIKEVP